MKVFISADIEGVTGVTAGSETNKDHPDYKDFQVQMAKEVAAACEGAKEAGATEIVIKDAHGSARNLIGDHLPDEAALIRGWSGHPYRMMQGVDKSFNASFFIGYHAPGGREGNPLAHTFKGKLISKITLNGDLASELSFNMLTSFYEKVPVVLVTGDEMICADAREMLPEIHTVAVKRCVGGSTINISPQSSIEKIKESARTALADPGKNFVPEIPEFFTLTIHYNDFQEAYKASFYPGAELISPKAVQYENEDYPEILRMMHFVI
ncbi:MAG: hypothetical protein HKM93_01305 [Desulfobacteraceae bacterium]|nr:hypothetical protein [Desulfobacteraceae bacterium]